MVDIGRGTILVYSADGSYRGGIARPGRGPLEFNRPVILSRTADGYLLNDGVTHLLTLNRDRQAIASVTLHADQADAPLRALSLKETVLLAEGLFGYADLEVAGKRYTSGFAWLKTKPLVVTELVEEIPIDGRGRDLYLLVGSPLAVLRGTPYFLRYGDPSYIATGTRPFRRLEAFPEEFRKVPRLPRSEGMSTTAIRYKALEQSAAAVGLYAEGDFLYLVSRKPVPDGKTLWSLTQIDPERDAIVRTFNLPTSASFLVIAPGSKKWAMLEKGPVTAPGKQEVSSLLLIPSQWLSSEASPLAANGEEVRVDLCESSP